MAMTSSTKLIGGAIVVGGLILIYVGYKKLK